MRANRFLQPCVLLLLASSMMASIGQPRPCSAVPSDEREAARVSGACTDAAPTDQLSPKKSEPAPVVIPIPNVVGLTLGRRPRPAVRLLSAACVSSQRRAWGHGARAAAGVAGARRDGHRYQRRRVRRHAEAGSDRAKSHRRSAARPQTVRRGAVQPMPQIVGMPIAQAQARLREFRIERIDRPNNASIGEVIAQSPKALESIARGQPITLIVSSGPADSAAAKAKNLAKREVVTRKTSPAQKTSPARPPVLNRRQFHDPSTPIRRLLRPNPRSSASRFPALPRKARC